MGLWEVKDDKKTLNKELFLSHMEKHWLDWAAEKLSRKEKQAWVGITEIVYKGKVKAMADLPEPDTWAEVTTYKVLFPRSSSTLDTPPLPRSSSRRPISRNGSPM